nr:hypothetical protein [Pseudovibrio sp. M1P-2-3]
MYSPPSGCLNISHVRSASVFPEGTQVDFAEFNVEFTSEPGIPRKVWLFSYILGHSRFLWGHYCNNQRLFCIVILQP